MTVQRLAPNSEKDIDCEDKLWKAADKLRSNMVAAEYKHVVLRLLFVKYISEAISEVYEELRERSILLSKGR